MHPQQTHRVIYEPLPERQSIFKAAQLVDLFACLSDQVRLSCRPGVDSFRSPTPPPLLPWTQSRRNLKHSIRYACVYMCTCVLMSVYVRIDRCLRVHMYAAGVTQRAHTLVCTRLAPILIGSLPRLPAILPTLLHRKPKIKLLIPPFPRQDFAISVHKADIKGCRPAAPLSLPMNTPD